MRNLSSIIACPKCHSSLPGDNSTECSNCGLHFEKLGQVYNFVSRELYPTDSDYEKTRQIISFWGAGWEKRMAEDDCNFLYDLTREELETYLDEFSRFHKENNFLFGNEIDAAGLQDKTVLNIGCGAGDESAFLAYNGSSCIAMDVTFQAAEAAVRLMTLLGTAGIGIQADSRFIPVEDNSVDVVYSSGVLHHSPNIAKSIEEIYRVLTRGGKAFIMLYATWSLIFLQSRMIGFVKGYIKKDRQIEYMSRDSENDWDTESRKNPYTETFSVSECKELFSHFSGVSVRKGGFDLCQLRLLGPLFGSGSINSLAKKSLESKLGACLFISAEK